MVFFGGSAGGGRRGSEEGDGDVCQVIPVYQILKLNLKGGIAMRKSSFKLWAFLFAAAFMAGAGGCGGGSDSSATLVKFVGVPEKIDFLSDGWQKQVKDAIGGSNLTGEDLEVFFLHKASVSDAVDAGVKDAYGRGAAVVLVEPTDESLGQLAAAMGHSPAVPVSGGGEENPSVLYAVLSNSSGEHTYVISKGVRRPAEQTPEPEVTTEPGEENESVGEELALRPAQEDEEASELSQEGLDHFIGWLKNGGPENKNKNAAQAGFRVSAAGDNIQDIVKAQTVTFNTTTCSVWSILGFRPSTTYTNTYFIYAVYSFDQDYDYYIIDQESMVVNGPMYKGRFDEPSQTQGHDMAFYLYSYYTDHYLRTAANADLIQGESNLIQPQPTTGTGSSSYTTSQSYNIGGSLGFSGMGGTGSISAGATYTSSRTTNVADIQINNQAMNPGITVDGTPTNARWTYAVQNLPHPVNKFTIFYPHNSEIIPDPPAIAVNTAIFYNSWIWRIPNPKQYSGNFKIYCRYSPEYAYCYSRASWPDFYSGDNYHGGYVAEQTITVTPPPRTK
jgi:hypothetical protein